MRTKICILLTLFVTLFSFSLTAQQNPDSKVRPAVLAYYHEYGDASISLSPVIMFNSAFGAKFAAGVRIRMYLGKRISLDADLEFGHDYMHFGPGIFGIPILYFLNEYSGRNDDDYPGDESEGNTLTEMLIMGALVIMSVEHIAYHIPLSPKTDLSPYVSFLRLNQYPENLRSDYSFMEHELQSFAAGLEFNIHFKRLVISPYMEYNTAYKYMNPGVNIGLHCGWYIPSR